MPIKIIAKISTNIEIAKKALKVSVTYRLNTLFEVLSVVFGFYIQICVWTALYSGRAALNGINLRDMISYILVSSFVSALGYSNIAFKIAGQVKDGTIGNELVKPINYKHMIMFHELGENLSHSIFIKLPIVILYGVIIKAMLPASFLNFIMFLTSVVLGITIIYGLNFIYGILAFWLKTSEYVNFMSRALMTLFAGSFVPLWFYPQLLYDISKVLPFRFITFEPMQIYLGKVDLNGALYIIGFQIAWIFVLTIIQKLMWQSVQRYLIVQGG